MVGRGDEELVGGAAALAGETSLFGEAVDEFAGDGDAGVGSQVEREFFAGHDGFRLPVVTNVLSRKVLTGPARKGKSVGLAV